MRQSVGFYLDRFGLVGKTDVTPDTIKATESGDLIISFKVDLKDIVEISSDCDNVKPLDKPTAFSIKASIKNFLDTLKKDAEKEKAKGGPNVISFEDAKKKWIQKKGDFDDIG